MQNSQSGHASKEVKFEKLAEAAVKILLNGNVSDLNYTSLARRSKVSRAWIYKYFGKNKDSLLEFVVDLYGKRFSELDQERFIGNAQEWVDKIVASTGKSLEDVMKYPWIVPLYFRHRHGDHLFGKKIRELEELFFTKFLSEMPTSYCSDAKERRFIAESLMALRFGVWYRWHDARFRDSYGQERVLEMVRTFLEGHRVKSH